MKMLALVAGLLFSAASSLSPTTAESGGKKVCCQAKTLSCLTCRFGSKKKACDAFPWTKGCASAGRNGSCACAKEIILSHPGQMKRAWCIHTNGHTYRKTHCHDCKTEACCAKGGAWWLPKGLCKFQPDGPKPQTPAPVTPPTHYPTKKPKTPAPVTPPTHQPTKKPKTPAPVTPPTHQPTKKPEKKGTCGCIQERFANLGKGRKAYCKNANGYIYHKHYCTDCTTESCCKIGGRSWLPKNTCKFVPEPVGTCGCAWYRYANLGQGMKSYCKHSNGHIYHKHYCHDCTTAACCKIGGRTWLPKGTCKFTPRAKTGRRMGGDSMWEESMWEESLEASLDLVESEHDWDNVTESDSSGRRMNLEESLAPFHMDFTNVTVSQ